MLKAATTTTFESWYSPNTTTPCCYSGQRPHHHLDVIKEEKTTTIINNNIENTNEDNNDKNMNTMEAFNLSKVESSLGMPWTSSIASSSSRTSSSSSSQSQSQSQRQEAAELTYMKFWEWQIQFIKENLTNVKVCNDNDYDKFSYKESDNNNNNKKASRIVNICIKSNEYRKIRMTYLDGGYNTQVFNSVWYPNNNLPILGIDLLTFNQRKYLTIIDFQPIHSTNNNHNNNHDNDEIKFADGRSTTTDTTYDYEEILKSIKEQHCKSLHRSGQQRMSTKFYDENQFFSKEMLFARFNHTNKNLVMDEVFPTFQSYVETHLSLLRNNSNSDSTIVANSKDTKEYILQQHQAYDTYSAERDPATGLFTSMFGKEWANDFVYKFLFSLSKSQKEEEED